MNLESAYTRKLQYAVKCGFLRGSEIWIRGKDFFLWEYSNRTMYKTTGYVECVNPEKSVEGILGIIREEIPATLEDIDQALENKAVEGYVCASMLL